MHDYTRAQSLARGFTLIEAIVGLATLAIIAMVLTALFTAGVKSFVYASQQTAILTNARKMYEGDGAAHGFMWTLRDAKALQGISPTTLDLLDSDGSAVQFTLSNNSLTRTQNSRTVTLGKNVKAFTPAYYNLDSSGRIMISTSAATAAFVTVYVQSGQAGKKSYAFFCGMRLRNRS